MTDTWVPFAYREFYDFARAIVVELSSDEYFLDCPFDDDLDDYPPEYRVYRLPCCDASRLRGDWSGLDIIGSYVGSVSVRSIQFDESRRRLINVEFLQRLTMTDDRLKRTTGRRREEPVPVNVPPVEMIDFPPSDTARPDFGRIPADFLDGRYSADAQAVLISADGRDIWIFGREGGAVRIGVDGSSGEVVSVNTRGSVRLVNHSLKQFAACITAAREICPLYEDGTAGDTEEYQRAADHLKAVVEPLDPGCFEPDGFWDTLYWDATMGDLGADQFD